MLEKVHVDYRESEDPGDARSVAERLAARALREIGQGGIAGPEGRYEDVGDYDPVLRSHCRLEERGAD
jgi:hypothetical protein